MVEIEESTVEAVVNLYLILAIIALDPGPLDAFRANFSSIRADVDYRYDFGHADSASLDGEGLWKGPPRNLVELANHSIIGRWEYDGEVERYESRSPADVLKERRAETKAGFNPFWVEPFELLFDGEVAAFHFIKGDSIDPRASIIDVQFTQSPGLLTSTGGPFYWWDLDRFPLTVLSGILNIAVANDEPVLPDPKSPLHGSRRTCRPDGPTHREARRY